MINILLRLSKKIFNDEVIKEISSIDYSFVSEIVYNYFTNIFPKEYIKQNFKNIYEDEIYAIIERIKTYISKNVILKEVLKRTEIKDVIDIEGIINFNFNDYKLFIESEIDYSIYKLISINKYEDYMSLIDLYLQFQDSKCKILNLICNSDGSFIIMDEEYMTIKKGSVGDAGNFENDVMTDGDFLVSKILELAPEKIVIHGLNYFNNKNLLRTLNRLYSDRINYCVGCFYCHI